MNHQYSLNMTEGKMCVKILLFALPLAASGILQQLFNAADLAVVGQFAGKNALAAVGANGMLINLLVSLFLGLSIGTNVVISDFLGKKDDMHAQAAVHTSVLVSLICGAFLALIGIVFSRPLLQITSTPDEILDDAVLYLRIYFAGMPFLMLFNFESAILRSSGDTRRPLIVLLASGAVNLLLNLLFVIVFRMTVDGVALATLCSNFISAAVLMLLLMREQGSIRLNPRCLRIDLPILKKIAQIGIPAGLQSITFAFSNVIVQSSINSLGATVIAGNTAGHNCDSFTYYILNSYAQAAVSFISQNRGAGKPERCRTAARLCVTMGVATTFIISMLEVLFRNPICSLFTSDPQVLEIAAGRVLRTISFQFLNAAVDGLSGCLRGMGYSLLPALICIVSVCGIRLFLVLFVFPHFHTYNFLLAIYPVSWFFTCIPLLISCRRAFRRLLSGRTITLAGD